MKTRFASPLGVRSSLVVALAAAALAGCGGSGQPSTAVTDAPVIKSQPKNIGANIGDSVTFSASASGKGLSYQWFRGSAAIPGATSSKYTINPVGTADFGTYYVRVSNDAGDVNSNFVTLGAPSTGAPTITTQPTSVSTTSGSSATFSVVATGTGPLTYQWFRNGVAIDGATGASYTVGTVNGLTTGTYYVAITNAKGTTNSNTVNLAIAVPSAPVITTPPQSKAILIGRSTTFTVVATGTPPPTYQWYLNEALIPGATGSSYTVQNVSNETAGTYKVVATNASGSASASATLTAGSAPVVLTDLMDRSANQGSPVTFTIEASGTAPLTYTWYKGSTVVAVTTVPSYTFTVSSTSGNQTYRVVVSNDFGSDSSRSATLTVVGPPTITQQPAGATVGVGSQATFSVTATGSGPLTYQWYRNGAAISGATGTTYTTAATTTADSGATFYVIVKATNSGLTTQSNTVTLNVRSAPTITSQPQSVSVPAGQSTTFSVTATVPSGTLSYQWRKNGAFIAGQTGRTLTITAAAADNGAAYSVIVYNDGLQDASTTSGNAILTVTNP